MAILKRKNIPDPTIEATIEPDHKGRNPLLQGIRLDVYTFIAANPGCTRADVIKALKLRSSSATARVRELIDEGMVYESGRIKSSSGVTVRQLFAEKRNVAGRPRDRVRVKVQIFIDEEGRYFAKAEIPGGGIPVDGLMHIMQKEITVMVPKLGQLPAQSNESPVAKMTSSESVEAKKLTIETNFRRMQ